MIQLNDHFNVAGSHPAHSIPRQHEMLINGKQMQRQQVNHIVNTIKTQIQFNSIQQQDNWSFAGQFQCKHKTNDFISTKHDTQTDITLTLHQQQL